MVTKYWRLVSHLHPSFNPLVSQKGFYYSYSHALFLCFQRSIKVPSQTPPRP